MDNLQDLLQKLDCSQVPWLLKAWQEWGTHRSQNRLGHAYLIQAANGLAVEVLVREITNLQLCQQPVKGEQGFQACGRCSGCHLFAQNQHPDFYHLKRLEDKKEISIAQIRELIEKQNQTAHQGGYKVIWIQEVERLSISAFNALLKSLEEPGANTLFLLTSSQATSLPATIRSRCQKVTVPQPSLNDSVAWLQSVLPQQDEALIKRALRLNWSAPVSAYDWIVQGRFKEEREWQETMTSLASGHKNFSKVASEWLKWSQPEVVFDYFYAWVLAKIRKLGYGLHNLSSEDNSPAGEVLHAQQQMQAWLGFQKSVSLAKNDWQGNANKELVFENLLMEWLELTQQENSNTLGNTPSQSVFQSNLNRGIF